MLDDMKAVDKQLEVVSEEQPKSWKRKSLFIFAAIIILICLAFGIKFLFFPSADNDQTDYLHCSFTISESIG